MRNVFFLLMLFPFCVSAQVREGFAIKGTITGFADGTNISFFQQNTRRLDSVGIVMNDTFYIKGEHLSEPEYRFLVFDKKDPVIPLLVDNGEIILTGDTSDLSNLKISGVQSAVDYNDLVKVYRGLNEIFTERDFSPENVKKFATSTKDFVTSHPNSYASLIAILQLFQLTDRAAEAEGLMKIVDKSQKNSQLAQYLKQKIDDGKLTDIGSTILPFTQNDTIGVPVSIDDFKGKYVLIDFWASWCRPCRIENPNVVANFERFKDKNFTVLGVSLDQTKEKWLDAIKQDHLTWTHVSDLKYWDNEVSRMFHIYQIPTNLLIDPNGVIIAKNIRGEELGQTLERILTN